MHNQRYFSIRHPHHTYSFLGTHITFYRTVFPFKILKPKATLYTVFKNKCIKHLVSIKRRILENMRILFFVHL